MGLGTEVGGCEEGVGMVEADTEEVEEEEEEEGGALLRRALKELMNSRALGLSPRRAFRCSAAASFGRVEV